MLTRDKQLENSEDGSIHCVIFTVNGSKGVATYQVQYGKDLLIVDLFYHTHRPQYRGQIALPDCRFLGSACYCDGTTFASIEPFLAGDEERIYRMLETRYHGIQ